MPYHVSFEILRNSEIHRVSFSHEHDARVYFDVLCKDTQVSYARMETAWGRIISEFKD